MTAPDRPLSAERRAAIEAMLAAITHGEWSWSTYDDECPGGKIFADSLISRPGSVYFATLNSNIPGGFVAESQAFLEQWYDPDTGTNEESEFPYFGIRPTDAAFIAAAPTIVRELLAAHDAAVARANALLAAVTNQPEDVRTEILRDVLGFAFNGDDTAYVALMREWLGTMMDGMRDSAVMMADVKGEAE